MFHKRIVQNIKKLITTCLFLIQTKFSPQNNDIPNFLSQKLVAEKKYFHKKSFFSPKNFSSTVILFTEPKPLKINQKKKFSFTKN